MLSVEVRFMCARYEGGPEGEIFGNGDLQGPNLT